MNIEAISDYCMAKPKVSSGFPFRKETLVFKKGDKVFCLVRIDQVPLTLNVKAKPEDVIELRDKYPAIREGYHMNKKFWVTVILDGSISEDILRSLIDNSYQLIR